MKMTDNRVLVMAFTEDRYALLLNAVQAIHLCETADPDMTFMNEHGRDAMLRMFELYCGCIKAEPAMTDYDYTIPKLTALLKQFATEILLHHRPSHTLLGIYREVSVMLETLLDGAWFA